MLGVVADVTDRVLLQRELEQLRASNDSQSALLLQLLQTEPLQLQSFLNNVEVGVRRSNALLRSPGIGAAELQQKLQGVFREMHALKGEAAALGMDSFVERTHAIEELLAALRVKPALAGDDFVPVVVKLDDLLGHKQLLRRCRSASTRRASSRLRPTTFRRRSTATRRSSRRARRPLRWRPRRALPASSRHCSGWRAKSARPAAREVRLACEGLERVPAEYAGVVRDICIQMVRNAIVHGIEGREQRAAAGKPPAGTIRVRFSEAESAGLLTAGRGRRPGTRHRTDPRSRARARAARRRAGRRARTRAAPTG